MDEPHNSPRLIIVSNRLPITVFKEDGQIKSKAGSGGLVTAIAPVLKNRGGVWIGWPGLVEEQEKHQVIDILEKENKKVGFYLHPVFLSEEDVKQYYEGFSNEIMWPLLHDLPSECNFDPVYWKAIQDVNHKFAEEIRRLIRPQDFIWIHDYHLLLVGQDLRRSGVTEQIGFFLHTPFPALDIFLKLPWRFQILRALLEYDLIGFQTQRDKRNFIQCVKRLLPDIKTINQRQLYVCQTPTREVRIGAFPISIDYQEFSKMAAGKEVENQAGYNLEHLKGQAIILSCDRLDISKGIPYRLNAIRHLLTHHPELHGKVTFYQVIVPSRIENPKYKHLKEEIDRQVGEINSHFGKTGWMPIQYFYASLNRKELLALYRISKAALITPIKDGMNLVAKEFVASNVHEDGVLILSEFAGSASQMQHEALLINPYDIEAVAEAIYTALHLPIKDCKKRMRKMRRNVQKYDVFWWVQSYLHAAISKELHDFPIMDEYMPSELAVK